MTRNQRLWVILVVVVAAAECLYWLIAGGLWYELRTFYAQGDAAAIAEGTRNAYLLFAWSAVNVAATLAYAVRQRSWGRVLMVAVQAGDLTYGLWWSVPLALSTGQLQSADWVLLQPAAAAALLVALYTRWRH